MYRHCQRGYWRASKRWCKQLPQDAVSKALIRFANNEAGLSPAAVYGGPNGAIAQLKCLESWFQVLFGQRSSCLLLRSTNMCSCMLMRLLPQKRLSARTVHDSPSCCFATTRLLLLLLPRMYFCLTAAQVTGICICLACCCGCFAM